MIPLIHEFGTFLFVNQYPSSPEMRIGPILPLASTGSRNLGARLGDVAAHRTGRIVQQELRVGRDTKSRLLLIHLAGLARLWMMGVETPLNSKQRVSEAGGYLTRGIWRLLNAERHFVLELKPAADAVIDVDVGHYV